MSLLNHIIQKLYGEQDRQMEALAYQQQAAAAAQENLAFNRPPMFAAANAQLVWAVNIIDDGWPRAAEPPPTESAFSAEDY